MIANDGADYSTPVVLDSEGRLCFGHGIPDFTNNVWSNNYRFNSHAVVGGNKIFLMGGKQGDSSTRGA